MTAAARRHLIDIGEVARMLDARIQHLVLELLPDGRRAGSEWEARNPDTGNFGSFNVHLTGDKAGVWKNFVSGDGGDALDLVAHVRCGGDKSRALAWAKRYLGLETGDPRALEAARRATPTPEQLQRQREEADQATRNISRRIWLSASPELLDTPVDRYLRGRGIPLAEFTLGGKPRLPRAIRFHPRLWHDKSGRHWPAMVTGVTGPQAPGGFLAVHRTWLELLADGTVRKAPIEPNKMVLGAYAGGHISLWRGASGKPLGEAPDDEVVDITEGVEDGLSVAYALPDCRVIAAVSLSNMAALHLPPQIGAVRLWKQNDTKKPAIAAFDRVVRAHLAAGRKVLIPDIPREVKDVNDLLREEAAHG